MTGLASPELAARNLHDAWQQGDRDAGLSYAAEQAVDQLFRRPYYQVDYAGCDAEGSGFTCFYSAEGEGIKMTVAGNREEGYRVSEVSFTSS